VSVSGLSLFVPHIGSGGHSFIKGKRPLHIEIRLPDKRYDVNAEAVRYEELKEGEAGAGYLLGLRIRRILNGHNTQLFRSLSEYADLIR
jgi:hypothetical protein